MRTMGRPGAKTKSSPTKPVVKAAAKKIAQAAAKAKSVAKAKAKAAVKVKAEPPSPQKSSSLQEMVPVSQAASVDKKDISNFLGQMKRATSDDAVALYQHYKTLGKFDAQKQTLIAKWKADKSCKWYSSYSESFEKTSSTKKQGAVGWSTRLAGDQNSFLILFVLCLKSFALLRWEIANDMHRNPSSPSFNKLLDTLESSSEKWDESLPQEKFLKDQGELKYFWSSASGLAKFEEIDKHSEEFTSSVGGYEAKVNKGKGAATEDSAEEQAKYPVYTELKKTVGEAATVSRYLSDLSCLLVYLNC